MCPRWLFSHTTYLPHTLLSPQDLAKTNLAFVAATDPVVAFKYLEVNGW